MAEDRLTHIDSMTNVELRAELKRRGCSTSGNKKNLIAKLHAALQKEFEQSSLSHSVEHPQTETPVIHAALLTIDDQATAQHPSVHTLSIPQNDYPSSAPIIPIPQLLHITSSIEEEQFSSINIPKVNDTSLVSSTPKRKTRASSKKSSVDYSSNENSNTTSNQQVIDTEQNALEVSSNDNNVERLNPSKAEQQYNQSVTIDEEKNSATHDANDDSKNNNKMMDQSSDAILSADLKAATTKQQETTKEDESSSMHKPVKKAASQQQQEQVKTNRSQTSSLMKGLHRSTNNKINLSSEILKTLIPDISLLPESVVNDELDGLINEQSNDNNTNEQSVKEQVFETNMNNDFLSCDSMTIGDLADQKQPTNRTVVMNITTNSLSLNDDISTRKKQNLTSTHLPSFESTTSIDGKTNSIITDEPVRIKNVTAVNEPLSQILYIRGLTRPFSLLQLKELLRRYGTLVDGQFWLDKIKSQCLVTYHTIEEAQNAREALDGCRWPLTNPKTLSVRFAQQNELEFSKTHDLPPDQMSIDAIDRIIQDKPNIISSRRSTSPIDGVKSNTKKDHSDAREWDIPKLQEKTHEGVIIPEEEEESIKPNESSVKGLDEYFRKTNSKPSIYWLPLTEEQVIERNRRQQQRKTERDEERRKQELDENVQKSDSKSYRRSSPSQEKRKHSPSSSKRSSKRH
ncbi:unnamed protein product [Rotaria sp. Silwood1]|nr:unnamed protein product [Rotaria sp. Silwood1]